jgi:hypothetical protein
VILPHFELAGGPAKDASIRTHLVPLFSCPNIELWLLRAPMTAVIIMNPIRKLVAHASAKSKMP